jgi:hypothetical protein
VTNSGDVIVFDGGVTITMDMEKINKARDEKAKADAASAETVNKANNKVKSNVKGATADGGRKP